MNVEGRPVIIAGDLNDKRWVRMLVSLVSQNSLWDTRSLRHLLHLTNRYTIYCKMSASRLCASTGNAVPLSYFHVVRQHDIIQTLRTAECGYDITCTQSIMHRWPRLCHGYGRLVTCYWAILQKASCIYRTNIVVQRSPHAYRCTRTTLGVGVICYPPSPIRVIIVLRSRFTSQFEAEVWYTLHAVR